jgi:hypothetical protein
MVQMLGLYTAEKTMRDGQHGKGDEVVEDQHHDGVHAPAEIGPVIP